MGEEYSKPSPKEGIDMKAGRKSKRMLAALAVCILFLGMAAGVSAQSVLRVGNSTEPASLDPQYSTTGATQQASQQIFETIVGRDKNLRMVPSLAVSWKEVDSITWELKLRSEERRVG